MMVKVFPEMKTIRRASLQVLKNCGVFRVVRDSEWRRQRLLILCYHGTALEDEHCWRPGLYMPLQVFEQRLEAIKRGGYRVLPLAEAVQRLRTRGLPARSVVLTFDDGTYDFYKQVFPLVKKYGFPVTVYQTTYHSDQQIPIFSLVCSYMLWKRRGQVLDVSEELGLQTALDLRTPASRKAVMLKLLARTQNLTGMEKNKVAACLAAALEIDYEALMAKRIFHLMNWAQITELSAAGVDFQLHTHRHRTPSDAVLFVREIRENRQRLRELTGREAQHFCYPSGYYQPQFLPWLTAENVLSATTCDISLATVGHDPLLLPRFIDTPGQSQLEYESWLSGLGHILSRRRAAKVNIVSTGYLPLNAKTSEE